MEQKLLTLRNQPIISNEIQNTISKTKVLFAGCGLGSCVAESFARMGLEQFILIDNDIIESHNLNRQSFNFSDIGVSKVTALKNRIHTLNPSSEVSIYQDLLSFDNSDFYVSQCDLIIDTIDFLDLKAIISLHDSALFHKKPIISLFTAGWGAVGMFIPPNKDGSCWAREIFQVENIHNDKLSYTKSFINFFSKIKNQLNPQVSFMMEDVFRKMLDNKPCPAPNVIAGAQSAAIIAQKIFVNYLEGQKFTQAPDFIYLDLEQVFNNCKITIPSP